MPTHREIVQRMPVALARRPRQGGYPVPWFVPWNPRTGKWDFRYMGDHKIEQALAQSLCWVCGEPIERGRYAFVIGPMCAVNRTSAEPPCHVPCATYSARACPFLARPKMKRPSGAEGVIADGGHGLEPNADTSIAGIALMRNPGVAMVWVTESASYLKAVRLFDIGEPIKVQFFAHGREATREEIEHSIDTGLPHLRGLAEEEGPEAVAQLEAQVTEARELLPAA
jgi:hypothetical protein